MALPLGNEILQQNLAPTLQGIDRFGQLLAEQRRIASQRQYESERWLKEQQYAEALHQKHRSETLDDQRLLEEQRLAVERLHKAGEFGVPTEGRTQAQIDKDVHEAEEKHRITQALAMETVKRESDVKAASLKDIEAKRTRAKELGMTDKEANASDAATLTRYITNKEPEFTAAVGAARRAQLAKDYAAPENRDVVQQFNTLKSQYTHALHTSGGFNAYNNLPQLSPQQEQEIATQTFSLALNKVDEDRLNKYVNSNPSAQAAYQRVSQGIGTKADVSLMPPDLQQAMLQQHSVALDDFFKRNGHLFTGYQRNQGFLENLEVKGLKDSLDSMQKQYEFLGVAPGGNIDLNYRDNLGGGANPAAPFRPELPPGGAAPPSGAAPIGAVRTQVTVAGPGQMGVTAMSPNGAPASPPSPPPYGPPSPVDAYNAQLRAALHSQNGFEPLQNTFEQSMANLLPIIQGQIGASTSYHDPAWEFNRMYPVGSGARAHLPIELQNQAAAAALRATYGQ